MNSLYTVNVCLGTPQQCMVLSLDTGDYWLWVLAKNCNPCHTAESKFNKDKSSSFYSDYQKVYVDFIDGFIFGYESYDYCKIGKAKTQKVKFCLATQDYELDSFLADGGLGLSTGPGPNYYNYIESLYMSGFIENNIFSLYLNDNGFSDNQPELSSVLMIGEYNLTYARITEGARVLIDKPWEFSIDAVGYNNSIIKIQRNCILDSSESFIYGPMDDVVELQKIFIKNYECGFENHGFLTCKCYDLSFFKNIIVIVQGYILEITPQSYMYEDEGNCYLLVVYKKNDVNPEWVLGMPFFREFYMIFNYSEPSVMFYPSVRSREIPDRSESIRRWVIITIFTLGVVVVSVSLFIVYALYCKNPHRWLNTSVRNRAPN
ncbi:hypothetical protein SteCoe_14795 [Stentor coeruleus]|uniref:Peptidase A1 domain-containing protein n=1 Tax=Stentor coeruleus TaxID=5963 RepID=A0A1R2C5B5_9CILI|nr:hypothetical protein SteCoe_14795 [Stentor coeruleus]